jgi:hypothetical protein
LNGFAERKALNGKLVKAQIEFQKKIIRARFFGDFFLHPEEALEAIEQTFLGIPLNFSSEQVEKKIAVVLKRKKAELVGLSPIDFVLVAQEAIKSAWQK